MSSPAPAAQVITGDYEMSPREAATTRARGHGTQEHNIVHEVVDQNLLARNSAIGGEKN